jgi:hypothetical protein
MRSTCKIQVRIQGRRVLCGAHCHHDAFDGHMGQQVLPRTHTMGRGACYDFMRSCTSRLAWGQRAGTGYGSTGVTNTLLRLTAMASASRRAA